MLATTPYRALLTGIPVFLTAESFYDYLRAHVAACALYNALLVCVPETIEADVGAKGESAIGKRTCTDTLDERKVESAGDGVCQSPRARNSMTRSHYTDGACAQLGQTSSRADSRLLDELPAHRSVGAAFVDFVNKAAAERTMRVEFYMAGALLKWQSVGPVVAHPGSLNAACQKAALEERLHGYRAYCTERWRDGQRCININDHAANEGMTFSHETTTRGTSQAVLSKSPTFTGMDSLVKAGEQDVGQHGEEHASPLFAHDGRTARMDTPTSPGLRTQVSTTASMSDAWVRLYSDNRVAAPLSSKPNDAYGVAGGGDNTGEPCLCYAQLFEELQRAIRSCTLGHIHSLVALSANEVHIATDSYTAARLHELGHVVSAAQVRRLHGDGIPRCRGKRRRESSERESSSSSRSKDTYDMLESDENDSVDVCLRRCEPRRAREHECVQRRIWTVATYCRPRADVDILPRALSALPDAGDNNLTLATKSEVLEAMARVMSTTGGRCAGYRDAFGNIIFVSV